MSFDHAGLWAGVLAPNQVFSVYQAGTRTPATLYADADMSVTAGSSVASDGNGNVVFYAAPASYDLLAQPRPGVSEPPITVTVAVNPLDVGGGGAWGQSSTAKYAGSGSPVGVVTPSGVGDLYVDDTTPAVWQATGLTDADWQQSGTSVQTISPRLLPSVKWALVVPGNASSPPAWSYDGSWPAPATTVTATADGVLAIDSGSPALGDRVVVMDDWNDYFQLCTVTDVGSVSTPWVLTATADDIASSAWAVRITEGTIWAGGLAISSDAGTNNWYGSTASGTVSTASGYGSTASGYGSTASGTYSTASGYGSTASGYGSTASGYGSTASGTYSTASGTYSTASGYRSTASGTVSTASGNGSTASGTFSTASGYRSTAYGDGQVVDCSTDSNHQSGRVAVSTQTTDATPNAATNASGQPCVIRLVDATQTPVWNRTLRISGAIIARRTDTPGTDSSWTIPAGVMRGDGTSAYTWVGGTAPAPTVDKQDSAASTWAAALSIGVDPAGSGAAALELTVTGEAANTIQWEARIELDEVAG